MKCKKILSKRILNSEELYKSGEIAKYTLKFMSKHSIALTPKNYEDWFYVFCKALQDRHKMSDQNLFLLYEEYVKEKPAIFNEYDAKEFSKELKNVVFDSDTILENMDRNLEKHHGYIDESKKAIKTQNIEQIENLHKKITALEKENKQLKKYLNEKKVILHRLEDRFHEFKNLSYTDSLTKLLNRRAFDETLKKLKESKTDFSIIYLDIDDFKKINDTYGHAIGDEVLKNVGEILNSYIRKDTKAFRLGGEEFVILLPNINADIAYKIAERIRKIIENHRIHKKQQEINFTASFGVTTFKKGEDIQTFLERADKAMYQAKKSGKNRVVRL